jgi:GTP cyclohydrolase IA
MKELTNKEIADHEYIVRDLLKLLGQDLDREGLRDTPKRFIKAWDFFTSGRHRDPAEVFKSFEDGSANYDAMVFQGAIPFYSCCEHHLVTFFGVAHIGYIPEGRIVGLSKLAHLVEIFARRPQVQERLCTQVVDAICEHLKPSGAGVVMQCRHLCLESRGVQKPGTITFTSALRGAIRDEPETRAEFMSFVNTASQPLRGL